ncbi:hypothetical protein [Desulfoferrobacter suflitae]|uniref:hypothetical protein n=1 Tax=Desulfoferrobacter suflitae TaxID=2865782 RepID=UPI0021649E40|nr:hypothetical protein [Desulfoferrobacter suflitae]MCK8604014.1 hypothetical protein [Desulfoferrobacter suflitae]
MRNYRGLAVVPVIVIFGLVAGCAALNKNKNNVKELASAIEAFNTALRWGDFKQAAVFVAPAYQEKFWRQSDKLEGRMRLTEYDIRHINWQSTAHSVPVIIRYRYYFTNDPNLKTETVTQIWSYSEKMQNWLITQSGLDPLTIH